MVYAVAGSLSAGELFLLGGVFFCSLVVLGEVPVAFCELLFVLSSCAVLPLIFVLDLCFFILLVFPVCQAPAGWFSRGWLPLAGFWFSLSVVPRLLVLSSSVLLVSSRVPNGDKTTITATTKQNTNKKNMRAHLGLRVDALGKCVARRADREVDIFFESFF